MLTETVQSRIAGCAEASQIISGVAIGVGDVTLGLSGERKVWQAEHLRAAASTLEGVSINPLHSEQDVGEVIAAGFDPDRGVIYEAELEDSRLAEQVANGQLEVSIEADHADGGAVETDRGEAMLATQIEFTGLSLLQRGAAPSASASPGEAAALSAQAIHAALAEPPTVEFEVNGTTIDATPPEAVVNAVVEAQAAKDRFNDLSDCGTGVGDDRAATIESGELAPDDFTTGGDHETAIPDYLDSHEEDVAGIDEPPTQWDEATWTDGCGPVQYALWGGTATGTGLEWAERVADEIEIAQEDAAAADLDALSDGDVVAYRTGNGTLAYGKVRATIQQGQFDNLLSTDRVVTAPALLINRFEPGQGNEWVATDALVARKPESVTRHDGFPAAPASEGQVAEAALQAIPFESTNVTVDEIADGPGFTDAEWDGDAAVAAMPNPSEDANAAAALDQTHMVVPADDEARDAKSNWKLPFRTDPDAAANTRALVAIDAALSGARGGVEGLGDETRSTISDRVQAMLEAAPDDLFGTTQAADMATHRDDSANLQAVPDEFIFENPNQAVAKAEEMGIENGDIHQHDEGEDAVFMPAPSHEALVEMLEERGELAATAEFDEGDLVRWSTSASPGTGRVAEIVTEPGETVTANGADVTREATEEEPVYKLDNWTGEEFEAGTVIKSASELLGPWQNAPEAARMAQPDDPQGEVLDDEESDTMPEANLGSTLANTLADAIADMDMERADAVDAMADAAGIEDGTVNTILEGEIQCPPADRLAGFAEVVDMSEEELMDAAREDGCSFGDSSEENMSDQEEELRATLQQKNEEIARLEDRVEQLETERDDVASAYAAVLADAGSVFSEDELIEKFEVAELREKVEAADAASVDDVADKNTEATVRSGSSGEQASASATLSAAEQDQKAELEARLEDLEDKEGPLAEKERERVEAQLADLTGGDA